MNPVISQYMATIGRTGGRKSRRKLSPEQAQKMVQIREARRAYRDFHAECFWNSPAGLKILETDIPWVVDQLKKHGGQRGWERAQKLCR